MAPRLICLIQCNAKIVLDVGQKIEGIIQAYEDVETEKVNLSIGTEGISVSIEDPKSSIQNKFRSLDVKADYC